MKNSKFIKKPAIALYVMLCLVLSSCTERAKVVELQRIRVDTTYIYKIERYYGAKNFCDIETRKQKLNAGDYIVIVR